MNLLHQYLKSGKAVRSYSFFRKLSDMGLLKLSLYYQSSFPWLRIFINLTSELSIDELFKILTLHRLYPFFYCLQRTKPE